MRFDEILDSISEKEMVAYIKNSKPVDKEAGAHYMNTDEQKLNFAFYAKAVREHVGGKHSQSKTDKLLFKMLNNYTMLFIYQ